MRFITLAVLLLQAATPAQQKRVAGIPNPRMSGGWVADPAHHLTRSTIDSLNSWGQAARDGVALLAPKFFWRSMVELQFHGQPG